jgi:DNA-binding MarR family transcriptional regulator
MTPSLRSEIKMRAPFASLEEEVFLNLIRTAAVLEHDMAEGLKAFEVTLTQYNALRILRGAGSNGLCRNEVRDRLVAPVPDATRLLDRLADAGLVERVRDGDDRRFVTARITPRGLELLRRIEEPLARMHAAQLGHLSRADLRRLADLLEKARRN